MLRRVLLGWRDAAAEAAVQRALVVRQHARQERRVLLRAWRGWEEVVQHRRWVEGRLRLQQRCNDAAR